MILSEQAPRGPIRRPFARWHHVSDLWLRFGMLLASEMYTSAFFSCITITLQVTKEYVLKSEGPLADQ